MEKTTQAHNLSTAAGSTPDALSLIAQHYTFVDDARVLRFLDDHPDLVPMLVDLLAQLPSYFPMPRLVLTVVAGSGERTSGDAGRLLLFVATNLDATAAGQRLDALLIAWCPRRELQESGQFAIDVISSAAPKAAEEAAQLFLRRHSDAYRTHLDTTRRFLAAPDGSDEEALARADMAARLASEEGTALQQRGGDVSAVLARLRQRRRSGDKQ